MILDAFVAGFKSIAWLMMWSVGASAALGLTLVIFCLSIVILGMGCYALLLAVSPEEARKIREKYGHKADPEKANE